MSKRFFEASARVREITRHKNDSAHWAYRMLFGCAFLGALTFVLRACELR